jgi:hypothetical protein
MKKIAIVVALGLALVAPLVADTLSGSGQVRAEVRKVSGFHSVDMAGAGSLRLSRGSAYSVTVKLDDNLLPWYVTEVRNDVLMLHFKDGLSIRGNINLVVEVTMPSLAGLSLSGACEADLGKDFGGKELVIETSGASKLRGHIDYRSLRLSMSGSGTARLDGKADALSIKLTGAADVDASALAAINAAADLSGACHLFVRAEERLGIEANGASAVTWYGNAKVDSRTSGASTIRKGS